MALSIAKLSRIKVLIQGLDVTLNQIRRDAPVICTQQVARMPSSKHFDPKWKKQRREKFKKIDLPDFHKIMKDSKLPAHEVRKKMKKEGRLPPRNFQERPLNISCTSSLFEEYVPPEGDGKSSFISTEGAKDRMTEIQKKGKSFLEIRKIKKYDEFDYKEFAHFAQEIAIETHDLLQDVDKNEDRLHDLVTEKAFPEMTFGMWNKTFRWKFLESIEPPRVVHVRTTDMLSKENLYAQVTVRIHTKQKMAIYDRFGRLMFGSEDIIKDVLEYIVFENHIANEYGIWRLHGKIIPDWMPPKEPLKKTFRVPEFEEIPDDPGNEEQKETSVN